MAGTDDHRRLHLDQAAAEEGVLDGVGDAGDAELHANGTSPATSPAVSLMITNRQRAALRALGFSEETIRQMTPSEAHGRLGLA